MDSIFLFPEDDSAASGEREDNDDEAAETDERDIEELQIGDE